MRFNKLADIIIEAKGEKPGQRYHSARGSSGPAGMSSTPVGRRDFNPELSKPVKGHIVDTKAASVRKAEKILRHSFRVIKASPTFRKRINKILVSFDKKRKQIRSDQEKVLSYNPGHIDTLWGKKYRLQKVIQALDGDGREDEYIVELESVEEKILKYQEDLDDVIEQVNDTIQKNEQASTQAEGEIVKSVQRAASEEFDDLLTKLSDRDKAQITLRSLDQIDPDDFDEETMNQDEYRLELLNVLLSDNKNDNPILKFFDLMNVQYEEAKGSDTHFAGVKNNTQNVSVEMLFNRLPTSAFSFFYNATHDDVPLSRISSKKRKQVKAYTPIKKLLNDIKSEADFDDHKQELKDLIDDLDVDPGRMRALQDIISGPYKRRGATVIQRLTGMLRGVITEKCVPDSSADWLVLEILSKTSAD